MNFFNYLMTGYVYGSEDSPKQAPKNKSKGTIHPSFKPVNITVMI